MKVPDRTPVHFVILRQKLRSPRIPDLLFTSPADLYLARLFAAEVAYGE
jgi:hypothetical protein